MARIAQYSFANVNDNSAIFDGRSSSPLLEASTQPSNSTESAGDSQKSAPADDLFTPSVASELRGGFGKDEARPLTVRCGDIPPAAEKFCVGWWFLCHFFTIITPFFMYRLYVEQLCCSRSPSVVYLDRQRGLSVRSLVSGEHRLFNQVYLSLFTVARIQSILRVASILNSF